MRNAAGALAILAALAAAAAAGATQPSPSSVLAQAEKQTAQAASIRIGMTMSMRQGRRSITLSATGRELPARHRVSLDMDLSQMSPAVGTEKVLMVGSRAYVHLAALSTPAARKKGIKPWIVEDSSSALGVDPWSLGGSGPQGAAEDVRVAGAGVDLGVPVTRYTTEISLKKALAASPQFQKLVQSIHAPASLLKATVTARFDIDRSGYLREVTESFTLRLPGSSPLAMHLDFTLAGFGEAVQPIVAPPSYDVMTMDDFRRATGVVLPIA